MPAIIKMLRIVNLLIIALTMVLLRFYVIAPLLRIEGVSLVFGGLNFAILVFIMVLIAASGYLINDYFDVESDRINRPSKPLVGRDISKGMLFLLYYILNGVAIILGFYLAFQVNTLQLGLIFPILIIMLWYYSAKYQRTILWGNIVVSIITGFTVFVVWLFGFFALRSKPELFFDAYDSIGSINYFVWGFTYFAFITTLLREVLKDMQDMEGDRRTGSNTLPVAIGINKSKWVVYTLLIISIATLGYGQYLLYQQGFSWACWYFLITVQLLQVFIFVKLISAQKSSDFAFLANIMKVVMLAGVISMQLIYIGF